MSTAIIPAPSGGGTITVDTALDTTSTRPVQNKAIATAVNNLNNNKQDTLVSGTNIKTINNQNLLGSGNIDISSGGTITIDGELSDTSENPVQNKVIKAALDTKGTYSKPSGGIPASDLASGVIPTIPSIDSSLDASSTRAVQNKVVKAAIDAKYTKPSTGIPASDLASGVIPTIDSSLDSSSTRAVQNKVVKAAIDAKYTKPSGGIPASDIASGVIPTIPSIDSSLDASSTRAVQNKVVKAALDTKAGTSTATTSVNGLMSSDDKTKLNGIATGAEVNQNAFSNVVVGSTTIAADSKTDTLTLVAGTNVTLTPDATNDKVTITATDTTYESKSAASGGTAVSLVTTGEKYNWNNKASTSTATTSANGLMSLTDKSKLNGIATGAEVNQNAFSNVVVGSTTIAADSKTDTLTLVAGTNVTLTPDATNDKITIAASGGGGSRTYTKPWYINTSGTVVECDTIQAAINGCPVHGAVHIPWYGTTYTISSSLTINKPLTLTSDYYGYEIGEQTSEATRSEVTKTLISYTGTGYAINVASIGVIINNLMISTNGGGIYIHPNASQSNANSRYNRLTNIYIKCVNNSSINHTGINLQNTFKTVLENCVVFDSYIGFYIAYGTSITMTNCWAREYKLYGYCVEHVSYSTLINCCADITPSTITSSDSGQVSYIMNDCWSVSMISCGAENVGSYAYSIDSCYGMSCSVLILNANVVFGSSPIMVKDSEVVFTGCRNNSSNSSNALSISGTSTSCVTLVGCSAMEKADIRGTITNCSGRFWVYPTV